VTRNVFSCVLPLDVGDRKSALGLVTGGYVNVKSGQQDKGKYRTFDNVRSQLVCCWRPIAKRVTTFSISDTPFELWRLCHTCAHTSCSFNKWYHTSCLWKCVGSDGSSPNLLTSFSQTLSFPDCSYEWGEGFDLTHTYMPQSEQPSLGPNQKFSETFRSDSKSDNFEVRKQRKRSWGRVEMSPQIWDIPRYTKSFLFHLHLLHESFYGITGTNTYLNHLSRCQEDIGSVTWIILGQRNQPITTFSLDIAEVWTARNPRSLVSWC
jgi:hypothetical protein